LHASLRGEGERAWQFGLGADHNTVSLAKSGIDLKNELRGKTRGERFFREWFGIGGDVNNRVS
jgi:hypothetical protein